MALKIYKDKAIRSQKYVSVINRTQIIKKNCKINFRIKSKKNFLTKKSRTFKFLHFNIIFFNLHKN